MCTKRRSPRASTNDRETRRTSHPLANKKGGWGRAHIQVYNRENRENKIDTQWAKKTDNDELQQEKNNPIDHARKGMKVRKKAKRESNANSGHRANEKKGQTRHRIVECP